MSNDSGLATLVLFIERNSASRVTLKLPRVSDPPYGCARLRTLGGTFKTWTEGVKEMVKTRSPQAQRKLFHDNAVRFYGL